MTLGRFEGDGRNKMRARPEYTVAGSLPVAISRGTCRRLIKAFVETLCWDSQTGGTLWVIVEFCTVNGIQFVVRDSLPGIHGGWRLVVSDGR